MALFFLRFWQRTRDVLFLLFAVSFASQAAAHAAFALFAADPTESRPAFYVPRLLSYILIIAGVAAKNRKPGR